MGTSNPSISIGSALGRRLVQFVWALALATVLLFANFALLYLPNQILPADQFSRTMHEYYFAAVLCLTHAFFVSVMTNRAYEVQLQHNPKFTAIIQIAIRRFWILGLFWICISWLTILLTGNGYLAIPIIWISTAFTLLAPITQIERLGPVATLRRSALLVSRRYVRLILILVPAFALIEFLGYPAQTCSGECWGLFEGGAVMFPLLGLHMFLASYLGAILPVGIYVKAIAGDSSTDK